MLPTVQRVTKSASKSPATTCQNFRNQPINQLCLIKELRISHNQSHSANLTHNSTTPRIFNKGAVRMAKVNPFTLKQNLNFLVCSRTCCSVSTRTTQIFPERRKKNENRNFGKVTPFSTRDSCPISEFNFNLKIRDVHVAGFAIVSSFPLLAISNSDRHLRPGGHCLRFSRPSLLPLRRSRLPSLWARMMSQSAGPTNPQESTKTVRCVIKGRVQGVFYRNWTVENATQLGLKGWVRNRRDGSVEALFSGKQESVDEMQQRCRRGPPDAMVTGFQAVPCNDEPGTGFMRKPTV